MKDKLKIDEKEIAKLEDFFYRFKKKECGAMDCVADIMGVLIGLKKVAFVGFNYNEMENVDCLELRDLLEKLGLECVFSHRHFLTMGKMVWVEDISISRDIQLAVKIRDAFTALWKTMDDYGKILDKKAWAKATREVGLLLGYPDTAILSFIKNGLEDRDGDDSLTIIGGKYKHFAHSKKYLEKEVEIYDVPLNSALKKYVPKTYKLLNG